MRNKTVKARVQGNPDINLLKKRQQQRVFSLDLLCIADLYFPGVIQICGA